LNVQYKFGAEFQHDGAFDCSSFMQSVFGFVGIKLPRTALEQSKQGVPVAYEELRPGDLLFFKVTLRDVPVDHVGLYIGGGKMIQTNNERLDINIADVTSGKWRTHMVGARRDLVSNNSMKAASVTGVKRRLL
jgi:cell wall-associated NlpC family hydrolase